MKTFVPGTPIFACPFSMRQLEYKMTARLFTQLPWLHDLTLCSNAEHIFGSI